MNARIGVHPYCHARVSKRRESWRLAGKLVISCSLLAHDYDNYVVVFLPQAFELLCSWATN
jgi:hypothetical protein